MSSLRILLAVLLGFLVVGARAAEDAVHRYLYLAVPDGAQMESASGQGLLVFDIDAGFKFVRRIPLENVAGGRRASASRDRTAAAG